MRRFNTWLVIGSLAGAAGLCAAVSVQARAVSVQQAVRAQERVIHPQLNKVLRVANNPSSRPAKVERVVAALQHKVLRAAQAVARAHAGSSRIAAAQRNWVAAARQLGHGLGQLVGALRAAQNNQSALAKRDARNASRDINAAEAHAKKADRELGIH